MIRVTIPYPPSVNVYWRVVKNRIYSTNEAKKYKKDVSAICQAQFIFPITGSVAVAVKAFRPAKRGDLDNTLKVSLDALKGHAYHDDAQIIQIHAERHDDKVNPRLEIVVTELEFDFLDFGDKHALEVQGGAA